MYATYLKECLASNASGYYFTNIPGLCLTFIYAVAEHIFKDT
jgi:hypothetical protein